MNNIHFPEEKRTEVLKAIRELKGDYKQISEKLNLAQSVIKALDLESIYLKADELNLGRPDIKKYIVAVRNAKETTTWDNTNPRLSRARELYDEGVVEIATVKSNGMFILYAFPRKYKANRRGSYFKIYNCDGKLISGQNNTVVDINVMNKTAEA